jgi:hypothetical protein
MVLFSHVSQSVIVRGENRRHDFQMLIRFCGCFCLVHKTPNSDKTAVHPLPALTDTKGSIEPIKGKVAVVVVEKPVAATKEHRMIVLLVVVNDKHVST